MCKKEKAETNNLIVHGFFSLLQAEYEYIVMSAVASLRRSFTILLSCYILIVRDRRDRSWLELSMISSIFHNKWYFSFPFWQWFLNHSQNNMNSSRSTNAILVCLHALQSAWVCLLLVTMIYVVYFFKPSSLEADGHKLVMLCTTTTELSRHSYFSGVSPFTLVKKSLIKPTYIQRGQVINKASFLV